MFNGNLRLWKGYESCSRQHLGAGSERHLTDYGSRTLLQEFNAMYKKTHLSSNLHTLCNAKNDDPVGRTTRLLEEARDQMYVRIRLSTITMDRTLAKAEKASVVSGPLALNLAKVWHQDSAAKWITSYAAHLSPGSPQPLNTEETYMVPGAVDPDALGGEIYQTVKELMKLQSIAGEP
jgi:hypothetical protein